MMCEYQRIAAAVPRVTPGDVSANLAEIDRLLAAPEMADAAAVVFPELCLTGYTCADLFYRPSLLAAAETALACLVRRTLSRGLLIVVGLPVRHDGRIFNCAAVLHKGLKGLVPKSYLPGTREFYESRWFATAQERTASTLDFAGEKGVPFGNDLLFAAGDAVYGVEICEDMWTANPPSTRLALQGANILLNPSASNEVVGKTEYRRALVTGQSARCLAAYVYAGAGPGESTTDLVFGGHALIAENGNLLAEGARFRRASHLTVADVDVDFLNYERSANFAFRQGSQTTDPVRRIELGETPRTVEGSLLRPHDPHPFVPGSADDRALRCAEILAIQSTGLATRLEAIRCRTVVLGLSGGLDSALALLVCVEAFDRLELPRTGIRCYSLPGFGTTKRTKNNAEELCAALGVALETVDISDLARLNLAELGRDESVKDVTYENAQARGRTYFLMNKANQLGGIVVGTGDLSELALGWCTYNGDHMSMYGVNAGVPKTLVRYVVEWYANEKDARARSPLFDILATPVSPELLPPTAAGEIAQKTEDKVGPYELHDFYLYHFLRRGASKEKIRRLAYETFPDYARETLDKWLDVFFVRFRTQQFKRSCLPDGPKVGSVNLSPRGDWRMPSDLAVLI